MGLENHDITLTYVKFGTNIEGVNLSNIFIDLKAPGGQDVRLQMAVWKRPHPDKSPQIPNQQDNQAVFISGFGTRSQDWPVAFESLGDHWSTVVGLDHPDAPTSSITPHDKPLNEDSFANSGFIILRAIENQIEDGTLNEGVTAVGLSTGCPVLLEAVAWDIKETEQGLHPRYIKSLILNAPAGMMNRENFSEITAGAGSAMWPYLTKNYVRDLYFRVLGKIKPKTSEKFQSQKNTTFRQLIENIRYAWNNEEWQEIKVLHSGFEVFEFVAEKLRISEFMAFFHRIWPNQNPHFLPTTPSIKRNQELVYRNVTEKARQIIHDTDVTIILFDKDKAVPPDGFITPEDLEQTDELQINEQDKAELSEINRRRQTARQEVNERRIENNEKPLPDLTPYDELWMLDNKKQDFMLDKIMKRVKELFPQNAGNTHVNICIGSNHLTPKVDIDLIADLVLSSK